MTFFKIDELISNFLHAALALAFATSAFGVAIHVGQYFA